MKRNNFLDGAIIASAAIIITKVLGLLYVIPFYSIIGEQGGALYGYAYNIYNIFLVISSAGIPLAISKITSEYEALNMQKEKKYMISYSKKIIWIFSMFSFLICFLGSDAIANIIIGDITGGNTISDVSFAIKFVSFALLFVPILGVLRGYLQGHKYIAVASLSQVIEQTARIIVIIFGTLIAIKVFHLKMAYAIGVALTGAAIGAIIAYIYLYIKSKKIKKIKDNTKLSIKEKKDIKKKVFLYAIPFIAVNLSYHIYNSIDMVLIIKTLDYLNYSATDIEAISSIFTTWGSKLISIVTAVATGLIISLIPNMVSSYVKKDIKEVNKIYQKTFEILLMIILPISCFLSIHSDAVWTVFYGQSHYGPIVFRYLSLLGFFYSIYLIFGSITQNLNKIKLIYLTILIGLGLNTLLDVPLMLLFNYIGIYPFYGAITATIIGYVGSLSLVMYKLNKEDNIKFNFSLIKNNLYKTLLILIPFNILISFINNYIDNRIYLLISLSIMGLISGIIYLFINNDFIETVINKNILKKLRIKKE